MVVSNDLVSQLVKTLNTDTSKTNTDSTVYGTVVYDGKTWVKLDGSDLLTPVTTTVDVADGDRVSVTIKDHQAVVTGNYTDPSASSKTVSSQGATISEFGSVIAYKVTTEDLAAVNGSIDNLYSKLANIDELHAGYLEAINADIESLRASYIESKEIDVEKLNAILIATDKITASFGEFTDIDTETINAINAEITNLRAYAAEFSHLSAVKAYIQTLDTKKLSAEQADIKYANIDFANIGEAAFQKIFADSGLIRDLVVGDSTITGELVGVTIRGDLIEAGTLKADRLVVKGSDGNYYKINTDFTAMPGVTPVEEDAIHGSVLIAKSLTAEKIAVEDLVAFGATVGGFNITDKSLYSGVKSSIDNTTRGIYMDTLGQLHIGDEDSFLKYYCTLPITPIVKDGVFSIATDSSLKVSSSVADGVLTVSTEDVNKIDAKIVDGVLDISGAVYKLEISADSVLFGDGSKAEDLKYLTEYIKMGRIEDETAEDGYRPCIELSEGDNGLKQVITNTETRFVDDAVVKTTISKDGIDTENMSVSKEFRQSGDKNKGQFIWAVRANGNYGLSWKAVNS